MVNIFHSEEGVDKPKLIPLSNCVEYPEEEMKQRAAFFAGLAQKRRTVRDFSNRAVPTEIIIDCIRAAATAPNGANMQPWHFVVVSDPGIKRQIREAAEIEEREFYQKRAPQEWLDALAPLGTDENKPFLEESPCLIVIFAQAYGVLPDGRKVKNYYVAESVGIATGILVTAIHYAGLVSLTHTPSPMGFLNEILHRPSHERPFLILVVGYPADDPGLTDRLPLEAVVHHETYSNYTPADIDRLYQEKESLPLTASLLEINQLETLAQIFTQKRYTKKDNEFFSEKYLEVIRKQGFLGRD